MLEIGLSTSNVPSYPLWLYYSSAISPLSFWTKKICYYSYFSVTWETDFSLFTFNIFVCLLCFITLILMSLDVLIFVHFCKIFVFILFGFPYVSQLPMVLHHSSDVEGHYTCKYFTGSFIFLLFLAFPLNMLTYSTIPPWVSETMFIIPSCLLSLDQV